MSAWVLLSIPCKKASSHYLVISKVTLNNNDSYDTFVRAQQEMEARSMDYRSSMLTATTPRPCSFNGNHDIERAEVLRQNHL